MRAALLGAALVLSLTSAGTGADGDALAPANGTLPGGGTYLIRPGGGANVAAVALWYRAPAGGFGTTAIPGLGRLAASAVAASRPITGTSLSQFARQVGGKLTINAYPESIAVSLVVPAAARARRGPSGDAVRTSRRS